MPGDSGPEASLKIGGCRKGDQREIREILETTREAAMWSEGALAAACGDGGGEFLIGRIGKVIVGFIIGRSMGDEAEILNLAVRCEVRGRGVGTALVKALLNRYARGNVVRRTFLEVRESNRVAIAFYEGLGFKKIGRRERYYREPDEAALILARETGPRG
jgi:[ribosomal protein S18]-alanine N-acetyltransferase